MTKTKISRITSIDLLRGLVMVIMALDHVRDYFHDEAFLFNPTDVNQTYPLLFFTRFITHFCAPVFVFLAGTSAYLVGLRRTKKELTTWLLKRGVWLIITELTIIKLAWHFQLDFSFNLLGVIWVIGVSMIVLAGIIHLPKIPGLVISLLFVIGHNMLDGINPSDSALAGLWNLLHRFGPVPIGNSIQMVIYPMIPWVFVMPLGYYFGQLFRKDISAEFRVKRLMQLGILCTLAFLVLRLLNVYGDPVPWSDQPSLSGTVMSFFNVSKYPPSLLYLLVTLGPSFIFLAIAEKWQGSFSQKLITIGRVPMFYYVIHLYLIHFLALIAAVLNGYQASSMVVDRFVTLEPNLQGYGFSLGVVYLVWIAVVLILYPICSRYQVYKQNNRDKWWLHYL